MAPVGEFTTQGGTAGAEPHGQIADSGKAWKKLKKSGGQPLRPRVCTAQKPVRGVPPDFFSFFQSQKSPGPRERDPQARERAPPPAVLKTAENGAGWRVYYPGWDGGAQRQKICTFWRVYYSLHFSGTRPLEPSKVLAPTHTARLSGRRRGGRDAMARAALCRRTQAVGPAGQTLGCCAPRLTRLTLGRSHRPRSRSKSYKRRGRQHLNHFASPSPTPSPTDPVPGTGSVGDGRPGKRKETDGKGARLAGTYVFRTHKSIYR